MGILAKIKEKYFQEPSMCAMHNDIKTSSPNLIYTREHTTTVAKY